MFFFLGLQPFFLFGAAGLVVRRFQAEHVPRKMPSNGLYLASVSAEMGGDYLGSLNARDLNQARFKGRLDGCLI